MAKELPYYKFEPAEWENGTVADCSLAAQGLFIRICNLYWQRQGLLSIDQFSKRFKQQKLIKELKNTSVLKEDGNKIKINFLDNQLAEFYDKSKKASESANKRWEESHTERNANVMRTHSEGNAIREEKRREEEIIGDNSKVGGNSTSTPNSLFPLKTNGTRPKRLANGGKVAFEDSPIFDRKAFKDRFPDWPKSKLKHYYESAEAYSTEGHKYVDWGKAINIWASRDEKKNKYRFEPDNKSDQDITIQFLNRM